MDEAVKEYQELFPTYENFASRMEALLREVLDAASVRFHFTESRAKPVASFAEKIVRPGKSYDKPLDEITDLAAVRLVLYYLDDVERVGALIRREFDVIEEVTEHQQDHFSPDQFGYLSMHYIVKLNAVRSALIEWKSYAKFRAEIQVRTVLQHSWAAVSHALQYKQEGDVPFRLRRRLSRLAGLFELADEEFVAIRNTKFEITEETEATSEQDFKEAALDAPVVRKFMATWTKFADAMAVMESLGYTHRPEDESEMHYASSVVEECERLNITTVAHLETVLDYDWEPLLRAYGRTTSWTLSTSFAIYVLLVGAFPKSFPLEYLLSKGWSEAGAQTLVDAIDSLED